MTDLAHAPDKELRKAWLKRNFASFEYHEELLHVHAQWLALVRRALERPEVSRDYAEMYRVFHEKYLDIFASVGEPGRLDPAKWKPGAAAGYARTIDGYTQIATSNYWEWMTQRELDVMAPLWNQMSYMSTNIRQTVDDLWFNPRKGNDDSILNDKYTGPIDWPPNWRTQVADVEDPPAKNDTPRSVAAGQPCPRTGWWFTPAAKTNARRYFNKGDVFPAIENSDYGATFWQWSPDQSAPKL